MSTRPALLTMFGVVVATAMAIAGCGGGSAASDSPDAPIKIAALVYQTGPLALRGETDNLRLAADEINAAGGVAGHQVELKLYDMGGTTPQQGRTAAQKALADQPTALIGPLVSAQTNAIVDLTTTANVPLLNLSAQPGQDLGKKNGSEWMFRLNISTDLQAQALARVAAEKLHADRVLVTHATDDTTTEESAVLVQELKSRGIAVADVVAYAPDATDETNAALAARGTAAVIALGYPRNHALLIKALRANGIDVPVLSDYGAESLVPDHLVPAVDLANTSYLSACKPAVAQSEDPAAKEFVAKFTNKYPDSYINGYYYDAVKIIAEGVKAAGGLDSGKLRAALAAIHGYHGACGDETADSAQNYLHGMAVVKMDGGNESDGGLVAGIQSGTR